jgi:serine/threonine-protein kinase HipA
MAKANASKAAPAALYVHIDRPDGCHWVGELHLDTEHDFNARFAYSPQWLAQGFALDPLNLPLQKGWFHTGSKHVTLGVLFDAAPDLWGRRVIEASQAFKSSDERQVLLMGRGNGVGALLFSDSPLNTRAALPNLSSLPNIEHDLEALHAAVHQVSLNTKDSHQQAVDWLAGSWSMGGARAKAVVRDANNQLYIAKFQEPNDTYDRQRIEYANLLMAKEIGIQVPAARVIDTKLGSVFLIERFDRTPNLDRRHYASAISLISAEPDSKRYESARDEALFSYARIAQVARKISAYPTKDMLEIYARMALNVCVKNTDDHLKNMGFIETEQGNGQLQLAPAFDVVTQNAGNLHFLRIGQQGRLGTIANVLSEPQRFGIKPKVAQDIVNNVQAVVAERDYYYGQAKLDSNTHQQVNALVDTRCARGPHRVSIGDIDID